MRSFRGIPAVPSELYTDGPKSSSLTELLDVRLAVLGRVPLNVTGQTGVQSPDEFPFVLHAQAHQSGERLRQSHKSFYFERFENNIEKRVLKRGSLEQVSGIQIA